MIELFGSALITFLVIIDPPGCAPIFASLTKGTTAAHRRAMAIRSSIIAWAILMFFALLGRPLLHWLGISLASFRIAGGSMLFFISIDMAPPIALRPKIGLLVKTSRRRIARSGMRSQFTVSPKASLMRTPFS